jgi:hypothetical protein
VLGCTQMQGFVFGGPMSSDEARRLIASMPIERFAADPATCLTNDRRAVSNVVVPLRRAFIFPEHSANDRSIA